MGEHAVIPFADERFDAVCMFSVITHQAPDEATAILSLIRKSIITKHLYFTAFIDEKLADYIEADPAHPLLLSTYNPGFMGSLLEKTGWRIERVYEPSFPQQTAFVCSPLYK
jgi:hypothetical protein